MAPVLVVAALALLFAGSHVGLAAARGPLVARLGERGFALLFFAVAWLTFAALVWFYASHRLEGPPGPGLGAIAALRAALLAVMAAGWLLMAAGLVVYPALPTALFAAPARVATGIQRITRHPFFAGFALFSASHALLAERLVGAVFFGALALLAAAGAWHQDRKLRARHGAAYAEYLAATSAVPFAAILWRRQRLALRELPWGALAGGVLLVPVATHYHAQLLAFDGAAAIGAVMLGSAYFLARRWRHARVEPLPRT